MIYDDKKIELVLDNLAKSKFRNSFKLSTKDIKYIENKGIDIIKQHAYDFVSKRLAPSFIENDGKQTPFKAHPVFIAQHATATCCRKCLYKWHKIKPGISLNSSEKDYIVDLIMAWLKRQLIKKDN